MFWSIGKCRKTDTKPWQTIVVYQDVTLTGGDVRCV